MKTTKYKFKIDEPRPTPPKMPEFSNLLSHVSKQIPWYSKAAFWGSAGTVTIASIAAWLVFSTGEIKETSSEKLNQNIPAATIEIPVENTTISDSPDIATETIHKTFVFNSQKAIIPYITEEHLAEPVSESEPETLSEMPVFAKTSALPQPISKVEFIHKYLNIPFDTITIHPANLPMKAILKNGNSIDIPQLSVQFENGQLVTGEFQLIYREITNQTEMIVSGMNLTTVINSKEANLENNGFIELKLEKGGRPLQISNTKPLLLNYRVQYNDPSFSGFFATEPSGPYSQLHIGTTEIPELNVTDFKAGRMAVKRTFGQWISDIFHGRRAGWDDYPEGVAPIEPGLRNNVRTFEVRSSGIYGSAKILKPYTQKAVIQVSCEGNELLDPLVYKVNLNNVSIEKYSVIDNQVELAFNSDDRCILLSPVSNSRFIAVLDANSFKRLVQNGYTPTVNVVLRLHRDMILNPEKLTELIDNLKSQKPLM